MRRCLGRAAVPFGALRLAVRGSAPKRVCQSEITGVVLASIAEALPNPAATKMKNRQPLRDYRFLMSGDGGI